MTRDLVVDDHAVVRHGLVRLLEAEEGLTVVGSAADGREAVDCCETLEPDVIVMDISMPVMDGVEATRRIVEATDERVQVVILTTFAEDERVRAAIDAGAVGYILKDADPEAIVAAVHSAAAGGAPLDPRVARALLRRTECARRADPERARARGAAADRRGPAEQGDRDPPRHLRGHREDAPHAHLPGDRRHRPHPGRALGAGERLRIARDVPGTS